jgi:hypothetical protein
MLNIKKSLRILSTAALLAFPLSADEGLEEIKRSMLYLGNYYETELSRSAELELRNFPLGSEISFQSCLDLEGRIARNYPFNPFSFQTERGHFFDPPCRDPRSGERYFYRRERLQNHFRIAAAATFQKVARVRIDGKSAYLYDSYLLDARFRIVERHTSFVDSFNRQLLLSYVRSQDQEGNMHVRGQNLQEMEWMRTGEAFYRGHELFSPADPRYIEAYRWYTDFKDEPTKHSVQISYLRADRADWWESFLPPTASRVFDYGRGMLTFTAQNTTELITKRSTDKEECSVAIRRNEGFLERFPANAEDFRACMSRN